MNTWGRKAGRITALALSGIFAVVPAARAMHIAEGFLPLPHALGWGVLTVPAVLVGLAAIRKRTDQSPRQLVLLALCGAFAFMLSALKIPSLTGSCSHPTGVGLGAILFGPATMTVIALLVLVFQALLLGHGGITTLGANTFSMGVAGPLVSFGVYRLATRAGAKIPVAVFLAAFAGNLLTYVVTAVQLALAHPLGGSVSASLVRFLGVFALTQIPLAVVEGLFTVVVFNVLSEYSREELKSLRVLQEERI